MVIFLMVERFELIHIPHQENISIITSSNPVIINLIAIVLRSSPIILVLYLHRYLIMFEYSGRLILLIL